MKPRRTLLQFIKSEFNPWAFHPAFWHPNNLIPDATTTRFEDMDVWDLKQRGIQGIAIDYDGVIAPYHSHGFPEKTKLEKINELKDHFRVVILSNRKGKLRESLERACSDLHIIQSKRMKPHPEPYESVADHFGLSANQIAIIEDRLVTGTAGAKRCGMYAVWVSPSEDRNTEPKNLRLYRLIEESFLRLYRRINITALNFEPRNQYFSVDFHFHLGKYVPLKTTLKRITEQVDCIALVGRGDRFANDFEFDFDSFVSALETNQIKYIQHNDVVVEVCEPNPHLIVLKGQELYTTEGLDVVVVGERKNFPDDISSREIVERSQQGITILSTPFAIPNTLRSRTKEDPLVREIAYGVDCIEEYNQSLFFNLANPKAHWLAKSLNKPGIAVSDFHKYSRKDQVLSLSHVRIPRRIIESSGVTDMIRMIKSAILKHTYTNVPRWSPRVFLETLSLNVGQIKRLYYGKN